MKTLRADLHVHTVLSPCAGVEMIPPLIVEQAAAQGIDLIAITDHNACGNVRAVIEAARLRGGPAVLAGMELQTQEEVHLLCLFDTPEQAEAWEAVVLESFPHLQNDPQHFGEQYVVDASGELVRSETRLLLTSARLSLEQAVEQVTALGGLAVPAHINRPAYGLIAQLGLVPPIFEALEISRHITAQQARERYPQIGAAPLLQNGDVHFLSDFLGSLLLEVANPSIAEIRLALRGAQGRAFRLAPPGG